MMIQDTKKTIEEALAKNNYSITDTARDLSCSMDRLHTLIAAYGVCTNPNVQPFNEDLRADLGKAITIAEDIIHMCVHIGDFRNGVTDGALDEGAVMASNAFYIAERKIKELKDRNNL